MAEPSPERSRVPYYKKAPNQRFVITGMDMITPVGIGLEPSFNALVRGEVGVRPVDFSQSHPDVDFSRSRTHIAAFNPDYKESPLLERKERRDAHISSQMGMDVGRGAIVQAGYYKDGGITGIDPQEIAITMGTCVGGLDYADVMSTRLHSRGPDQVPALSPLQFLLDRVPGVISIKDGIKGPIFAPEAACATGAASIILGIQMIKDEMATIALAGGSDHAVSPLGISSFANSRALSTRNDEPQKASRPFDESAEGFVIGAGAGAVVVETLEHALNRGAKPLVEVIGYGWKSDAFHETAPSDTGEAAIRSMKQAISRAGISPDDVGYVNAHATSTKKGDGTEALAISTAYGSDRSDLLVASSKSMTGHLLGAAGAVEAIVVAKAIIEGRIPPSVNLEKPIVDNLTFVGAKAVDRRIRIAGSNSFGFDGINTHLLLAAWDPSLG